MNVARSADELSLCTGGTGAPSANGRAVRLLIPLIALCLVGPVSAIGAQVAIEQPLGDVLVLAHRGASHENPEHTVYAYDAAVDAGADFLECDLQLTADEELVCIHDTTVDRTSDGTGPVESFTLAELRTLDFGSWFNELHPDQADPRFVGARVVTLEEQLDRYLQTPSARFHIETKAPEAHGGRMEPLLVEALDRRGLLDTGGPLDAAVVVQSFDLASLQRVDELAPTLVTAYLWAVPPPDVLGGDLPPGVDVAAPVAQAILADPTFVRRAHEAGHPVHTWTVDDEPTMEQLLDLGVDGIFTNRPDVLRRVVDERGVGTSAEERATRARRASVPTPVSTLPVTGRSGPNTRLLVALAAGAVGLALLSRSDSSRDDRQPSTSA